MRSPVHSGWYWGRICYVTICLMATQGGINNWKRVVVLQVWNNSSHQKTISSIRGVKSLKFCWLISRVLSARRVGFLYSQVCTFSRKTAVSGCCSSCCCAWPEKYSHSLLEEACSQELCCACSFFLPYTASREMSTHCPSPGTSHLLGWVRKCHYP